MRLQEVVDYVSLLYFNSILPSHFKQILSFGNQWPPSHLFSDEVYYEKQAPRLNHRSRVKANHLLTSQYLCLPCRLRSRLTPSFNQALHSVRESLNSSANRIQFISFSSFPVQLLITSHQRTEIQHHIWRIKKITTLWCLLIWWMVKTEVKTWDA